MEVIHNYFVSLSANLLLSPDKQLKVATFFVSCISNVTLQSETRYKQTVIWTDCISVKTGFYFDVAASCGTVGAILQFVDMSSSFYQVGDLRSHLCPDIAYSEL